MFNKNRRSYTFYSSRKYSSIILTVTVKEEECMGEFVSPEERQTIFNQTAKIEKWKGQIMLRINWIECLGYIASVLILISFLTNSILRLRWINFIGSSMFGIYGFLINSFPTGILNAIIGIINIYHILKIYNSKKKYVSLENISNRK